LVSAGLEGGAWSSGRLSARRAHEFCALAVILVVVGLHGGALSFRMPFLRQRALAIRGSYAGTLDELHVVVALGREGRIPPIPLDVRRAQAMADLRAGHIRGRVILKPDG
jgi:D-arabinose 1-dehydrogenase-like Zn-dependent alcohol dehydrogenase